MIDMKKICLEKQNRTQNDSKFLLPYFTYLEQHGFAKHGYGWMAFYLLVSRLQLTEYLLANDVVVFLKKYIKKNLSLPLYIIDRKSSIKLWHQTNNLDYIQMSPTKQPYIHFKRGDDTEQSRSNH